MLNIMFITTHTDFLPVLNLLMNQNITRYYLIWCKMDALNENLSSFTVTTQHLTSKIAGCILGAIMFHYKQHSPTENHRHFTNITASPVFQLNNDIEIYYVVSFRAGVVRHGQFTKSNGTLSFHHALDARHSQEQTAFCTVTTGKKSEEFLVWVFYGSLSCKTQHALKAYAAFTK